MDEYLKSQVDIIYEFMTHSKLSEHKKKELLGIKLREIQKKVEKQNSNHIKGLI